ncbi:hypothetical protein ACFY2T_05375 [Streptomyces sp. NPDC001260]|uniref:hypothetical protein n=1 Tax=Streptomyces sp. NPDC001260 TaxID=3364551 RepID=UPI0036B667D5
MPAFNRPPEWQQQADRHTELVDPVLTVRQLGRFDLNLKSFVRIDHALVFATPKGGYEAYLPPRRPTRGEIVANRYTAVYEVDMGVHPFSAELTLPSDNDAFEFTAAVDLSWQVLDPARFVASGHRDVPALALGELQQAARPVTRRFAIADSADAERELLQAVTVLGPLGAGAGLQVTWTLRVKRDQENIDHQRRLQAIGHSATEQIHAAEQGMRIDVEVDRRGRQQDQLQIERATDYGRRQQELILQQQRWQHEQAMLMSGQQHQLALEQGQQMLELQRIEAEKIEFYQYHLQQGGVHAWALHLAQHPEDSRLVMTSMREDQLRMIQAQMDLVGQLLSGDQAENYELEGPKQLALRTVSDILNQRLPGVPQNPPLMPSQGPGTAYGDTGHPGPPGAEPPAQVEQGFGAPGHGAQGHQAPTAPAPQSPAPAAPGPYGAPGAAPYPPPAPSAWQTPTAYAPAPPASVPYPGVPAPPPAAPPQPTSWQPPPGYGSTPTLPAQPPAPAPQPPATAPDPRDDSPEADGT